MERPLFWHQGLFLQPQHLQLADLHAQSLLTPVYKYLCPYPWGIGELEIQTAALDNLIGHAIGDRFRAVGAAIEHHHQLVRGRQARQAVGQLIRLFMRHHDGG